MSNDARYKILFEPVQIGPVTTKNRFYQVPHCNGTSDWAPKAVARMREIKAEGGWGVVCTEIVEVSNTTELHPFPGLHLWRDEDIAIQAQMVDAVHRHGALAGAELGHFGVAAGNRAIRLPPLGPSSHLTLESIEPFQCRAMDAQDIRTLRQQHKAAAVRAKQAGFDIIYVYAAHNLSIASHFLSRRYNQRGDEYGGSLENRVRLLRELLEDTKEAVGDRCAVAIRFAVDEMMGEDGLTCEGEGREVVELLKDLPDLWDVNVSDWSYDSDTSRFAKEGFQEPYTRFVKEVTGKPVVGVGRFTSPDTMVSQIKRGVMDLIGAARPSIADPFLPNKIAEGRVDDIRECIGCNICVSGEMSYSPIRCTQNPTMMEELRRGWHPEEIAPKGSEDSVLIVGGGPAGLECALSLGRRGYAVTLAEANDELGGRVSRESALPGLAEWARVRDYRLYQMQSMANVEIYKSSAMDAAQCLSFGARHIVTATGARWRRDGVGRSHFWAVPGTELPHVLTPDDVMEGHPVEGPVVIYDTDGSYLANAIAEKLRTEGHAVTLVTPAAELAGYLFLTLEQHKVIARMMEVGVEILRLKQLSRIERDSVVLDCVHGGESNTLAAATIVMVTARTPNDALYQALVESPDAQAAAGVTSVTRIGDCEAPSIIAAAVYAGHRYARSLDAGAVPYVPYLPEMNQDISTPKEEHTHHVQAELSPHRTGRARSQDGALRLHKS